MGGKRSDKLTIVELEEEHLLELGRPDLSAAVLGTFAFAAIVEGRAVAAGGIVEHMWRGRGYAWFVRKEDMPRWSWPGISRAVKKAVELALESEFHRVEMYVRTSDPGGCRWAQWLGFTCEGLHPMIFPDGSDGYSYGRTDQEAS